MSVSPMKLCEREPTPAFPPVPADPQADPRRIPLPTVRTTRVRQAVFRSGHTSGDEPVEARAHPLPDAGRRMWPVSSAVPGPARREVELGGHAAEGVVGAGQKVVREAAGDVAGLAEPGQGL